MRRVALITLVSFLLASCETLGGKALNEEQQKIEDFSGAVTAHAGAAVTAQAATVETVKVASRGFTLDLSAEMPPGEVSGPQAEALAEAALAHGRWVDAGGVLSSEAEAVLLGELGTARTMLVLDPGVSSDEARRMYGQKRGPLLMTALLIGSVVLAGWGAYKGVKSAVQTRAAPVRRKIKAANPTELAVINKSLGLDPDTSAAKTLEHFDGLGVGSKLRKAKAVEQDLRIAVVDGAPGVDDVDAGEINQSVANSSVTLGKTAVTTTVSVATTATGGQGYTQAMQAVGAQETTAAVVDFGISAVSTATDTPLQPLDLMAAHLDVAVVSKSTKEVTIPKPSKVLTLEEARAILRSSDPTEEDLDAAADTVALNVVEQHGAGLKPRTNADGSVTVTVAQRVHLASIDDPTNHVTLKVPKMGKADVLIIAKGKVPQTVENVDTDSQPILGYPVDDLASYGEGGPAAKYTLLVIASPADPAPGQDVGVKAQVNPPEAGVSVRFAVSGTDGYTDSSTAATDAAGQATFSIPGGQEGVVDTVTVELPEHGVRHVITYAF